MKITNLIMTTGVTVNLPNNKNKQSDNPICSTRDEISQPSWPISSRAATGNNDAIFKTGTVAAVGYVPAIAERDDGKIVLTKLSWYMPHVLPTDQQKISLYKTIESKSSLPVGYRIAPCDSISVPQTRNFTW